MNLSNIYGSRGYACVSHWVPPLFAFLLTAPCPTLVVPNMLARAIGEYSPLAFLNHCELFPSRTDVLMFKTRPKP